MDNVNETLDIHMANYLVTGGCGYIGSHLVDSLVAEGHNVRVLDDLSGGNIINTHKNCELIIGSVVDEHVVRSSMNGMDACFHLAEAVSAGTSHEQWLFTHGVNMMGSVNVFEAARKNKTPVVYGSSAAVYGDNAEMPLTERSTVSPLCSYGADKLAVELHARVATLEHGVPTVGLRFFNVYGGTCAVTSPRFGVIPLFVEQLANNQSLTIYGDGKQVRDFVHILDVIGFLRRALYKIERSPTVYNVCSGRPVSIEVLAKMMMRIYPAQIPIEYRAQRRGDIRVSVGDPSYAIASLGAVAKQPLVRGLRLLFESELMTFEGISA